MSSSSNISSASRYKWREISDLPEDLDSLRDGELEALFKAWTVEKAYFAESDVRDFSERLRREWAIETGIIEGVYTLDRGITQTLIERGIDSSYISHESTDRDPEIVARTIQAHAEVLDGLFDFVTGKRPLSLGYINELHAALLRYQSTVVVFDPPGRSFETELEKGKYKRLPNSPTRPDGAVHEYCPPEHVAPEMDRLIQLHDQHAASGVHAHIESAWFHHAFTQIHPFQDGNGRVARALASLVFIRAGFFPLVVNRDDKPRYIEALETADGGSLSQSAGLFSQIQKRSLTKAIGHAADVKPVSSVEEAIAVTRDMLVNTGRLPRREYLQARATADQLQRNAANRLVQMSTTLNQDIGTVDRRFSFVVSQFTNPGQAEELRPLAKQLGYEANDHDYNDSRTLDFNAGPIRSRITVSCHGIGAAFRGLLAVVAYFTRAEGEPVALCDDIFRISYTEPAEEAAQRFASWLDKCLINGLAAWRRTLV